MNQLFATKSLDQLLSEEAGEGRLSQHDAVGAYERSMIQYGFEAVRESLKQMTADTPIHHPVWGGPTLAATKAMFRVMNVLGPMKRRMAESETRLRDRQRHPALAAVGA